MDQEQTSWGKNMPRTCFNALTIWIIFLLCFIRCTSNEAPRVETEDNTTKTGDSGPIIVRLKWLYNTSVAGEIWARESGIFKARGLTVRLREGGPEQDAIKDLELGRAHFGVASADQVIRAASKGAHVVVLAQIFQVNPLQWIYDRGKLAIAKPQDLKGLCVGVTYGGNDEAILSALLRMYKIDPDDLELYAVHYDFNPFWKGEVELWPVYRNTQGIILRGKMAQSGKQAGFFNPAAFGIRFVANSIITSKEVYSEQPQLVRDFTEAVLEGWRDAMDPELELKVAETIHRLDPDTPVSVIQHQLAETRMLVVPESPGAIGTIDIRAWRQTAEILATQGLISHKVDITSLLAGPPP
ncbi:MAG: ABC transporter substrate-binding protein [Deltaproteobacteria bacterium]|nr:ABC transporter substrate-binding protein [Deltaproteobacteria bacterium]